jgi:hypothetical protein
MLKNDSYNTEYVLWKNHEVIELKSPAELLKWVNDDKSSYHLSKKIFGALIDCMEDNIDTMVVITINVMGSEKSGISIQIQRKNFQKIINGYVNKLIQNENYEMLAKIKPSIEKYGFEISQ